MTTTSYRALQAPNYPHETPGQKPGERPDKEGRDHMMTTQEREMSKRANYHNLSDADTDWCTCTGCETARALDGSGVGPTDTTGGTVTDTDDPRVELLDARSGRPTGTIPLSVLTDMGVTIPENGAYWFSAELRDAIRHHPDWTEGP